MADQATMTTPHVETTPVIPSMDYAEHERTYRLFTGLVKWVTGFLVVLLILLAYFLI